MRYLIIDTRFLNEKNETIQLLKQSGMLLSEEESLSKFKEVFEEGAFRFVTVDTLEHDWNEFKTQL